MAIITLLTDFGTKDEYVGVMKGVILSIHPAAAVVDLTHEIAPQDILQAAFILDAATSCFPIGTVHLAVVDPGVGSARAAVAVRSAGHMFVAPDNGLLTLIIAKGVDGVRRIENDHLFRKPVSATFHGRDIFAPVAAHLSAGLDFEILGPEISAESLVRVHPDIVERLGENKIEGCVVAIDRFGNLMTNITARTVEMLQRRFPDQKIGVLLGQRFIPTLHQTYSAVNVHQLLALIGSRGYLEISANMASAADQLGLGRGDRVIVLPEALHEAFIS